MLLCNVYKLHNCVSLDVHGYLSFCLSVFLLNCDVLVYHTYVTQKQYSETVDELYVVIFISLSPTVDRDYEALVHGWHGLIGLI